MLKGLHIVNITSQLITQMCQTSFVYFRDTFFYLKHQQDLRAVLWVPWV